MCKLECQIWKMQKRNSCIFLLKKMRTMMWLWVVFVSASECYGCLKQERIALLQLKDYLNHPLGHSLQTWEDALVGEATTDCCQWKRVTCSNTTGRVTQLDLHNTWNEDGGRNFLRSGYTSRNYEDGGWYLNASMFLPFEELESLDLSWNSLVGWLQNEGFEKLARLNNLESLDLRWNYLNISILSDLAGLTSLKTLYLAANLLVGKIHIDELRDLKNLQELDMSDNGIDGFITNSGFQRLSSFLPKLEVLKLDSNSFDNSILPFLSVLSSLKSLSMYSNHLNGSFDIGDSQNMSNLEDLDLSFNSITNVRGLKRLSTLKSLDLYSTSINSSILQSMGVPLSLKTLNIGANQLQGFVTRKGLDGLKHLQELYMSGSSIDESFLYNAGVMSSLRVWHLISIKLIGSLPEQGWCELSNLQELYLYWNDLEGMLPSCLGNLTSLRNLDLSYNQLSGNLALSPLTSLTKLEMLYLSYNRFEIPISFVPFFNLSKLKVLECGDNNLIDQIEFQTRIPRFQLQVFWLSNCWSNKLSLNLPHFLYCQYDLETVDLSHNIFLDKLPVWLLENNTRLQELSLRNNSLRGPLMLPSYPHSHLRIMDISHNLFDGQVPTSFSLIFPNLEALNMSRNLFEGQIPSSLGKLVSLMILDLSNNNFAGNVPKHLAIGCTSLVFLRLTNNSLYGQISPSLANLTKMMYLYLGNNHFVGKLPNSLSTLNLRVLDVSNNHLSGKVPRWMGNMSFLFGIDMVSNHFEGPIPVELCKLYILEFLDLSDNNLSGSIPSCFNCSTIRHVHLNKNNLRGLMTHTFYNCSSLVTIDLGHNNLSGTLPSWIGSLSSLSILILKFNHFEGKIPIQICQLKKLSILDLSQNNFSGLMPPCFSDITFEPSNQKALAFKDNVFYFTDNIQVTALGNYVEFKTKHGSYAYRGNILNYMSGIDISCNHLTGEIPPAIGNLGNIHALNLSHNYLTGSIPSNFSQLKLIESLDLSYNLLSGRIPPQLIGLNNLAVFNVAHNNLSGAIPDQKAQFSTFEESSYEGNPLLCGPPLHTDCTEAMPTSTMHKDQKEGEDDDFVDKESFYVSFIVSYTIVVLTTVAVLIINPHWRRAWFQLIEVCMISCNYFVLDSFRMMLNKRSV